MVDIENVSILYLIWSNVLPIGTVCVLADPLSPLPALVTPSAGEGHVVQDLSAEITELLVSYYQER